MPLLQKVLDEGRTRLEDLDAIGVGIGPGNFTGTRLSVAAARGLALSLGIPAIGVGTLEAMALGTDGPVLCSLDGRREKFYVQVFHDETRTAPGLFSFDEIPWPASETNVAVIGHRAEELANASGSAVCTPSYPLAEAIARIAAARMQEGTQPRPAPLYIRPADAAPPADPPPMILP